MPGNCTQISKGGPGAKLRIPKVLRLQGRRGLTVPGVDRLIVLSTFGRLQCSSPLSLDYGSSRLRSLKLVLEGDLRYPVVLQVERNMEACNIRHSRQSEF
jgi:hypothetical protein